MGKLEDGAQEEMVRIASVEEKKEWKIKRYCLIILIKFIQTITKQALSTKSITGHP